MKVRHKCEVAKATPKVSIHAPVKVRQLQIYGQDASSRFNSRTREGATYVKDNRPAGNVSIHAPVKVRHDLVGMSPVTRTFQFTHP